MKKAFLIFFLGCTFLTGSLFFPIPKTIKIGYAERNVPSHAKWGKVAMQRTKERYPNAEIYDYLHVKREQKVHTSVEIFKLWLREDDQKLEVYVAIEFDINTEKILHVNFREKDS